jgi:hypothetical protein
MRYKVRGIHKFPICSPIPLPTVITLVHNALTMHVIDRKSVDDRTLLFTLYIYAIINEQSISRLLSV